MTPETAVAVMTGALALATFWLAWEARNARHEARREDVRRILRAALAEQVGNLRDWLARDPARGEPAIRGLQGAEPRLAAVQAVVDRLDLPPDLVTYTIWLLAAAGDHWGRIERALDALPEAWGKPTGTLAIDSGVLEQLGDDWRAIVERLQVLAALMAAEARRRGLVDVAGPHDSAPWTVVPQRPPRWRELMAIAGIPRGEPPFPRDPAFAGVRPEARDRAGGETGARQMGALSNITGFPRGR